jgi:hypothetical protein
MRNKDSRVAERVMTKAALRVANELLAFTPSEMRASVRTELDLFAKARKAFREIPYRE